MCGPIQPDFVWLSNSFEPTVCNSFVFTCICAPLSVCAYICKRGGIRGKILEVFVHTYTQRICTDICNPGKSIMALTLTTAGLGLWQSILKFPHLCFICGYLVILPQWSKFLNYPNKLEQLYFPFKKRLGSVLSCH